MHSCQHGSYLFAGIAAGGFITLGMIGLCVGMVAIWVQGAMRQWLGGKG